MSIFDEIRDADVAAIRVCEHLPSVDDYDAVWNMSREYRESYTAAKYAVASVLKPLRICEIGVYSGIAATCFLVGSPHAAYVGIDDLSARYAPEMVRRAIQTLRVDMGHKVLVIESDTRGLADLPGEFDFVHVDGDHSRIGTCNDVVLAWRAMPAGGHILIDNGHDTGVAAGVFDALRMFPKYPVLNWAYLEWGVGSILIERPS